MIRIRGAGRQEYYQRLQVPMKIEALNEASHRRDKQVLERALAEARDAGIAQDHDGYVKAERELQVVETREALKEAMKSRDVTEIRRTIDVINRSPLYMSQLQHDIIDAERLADHLERLMWHKRKVLYLDKKAMTEMRRYHKPPILVHHVMKGVMLLLEIDEDVSSNWKICQHYLNPYGREGMNRKIVDFDPSTVHPEIAARVKVILSDYPLEDVQEVSPALATFYVWALGVADDVENIHSSRGTRPASIKRQKVLFKSNGVFDNSASKRKKEFVF